MDKIIVQNSCIIINDYKMGDSVRLEETFKVYNPMTHSFDHLGFYYDESNSKLYLPSGLDLWKIRSYFSQKYFKRISNHPYKHINILLRNKPRDEQQEEALRFMCGLGEYEDNAQCTQLSVNLNTGKGKTYCSIATIAFFKIRSIIITGSNTLLSQWKDEIIKYTNLMPNEVLQISGSEIIDMILMGRSKKYEFAKVYLCTHRTLGSYASQHGWNKIHELFEYLQIGLKFFDEAHTNFENMLMVDFFTNVFKTYYVTATPARSDWRENKIFKLSIKNVPAIDLFDENNDPHTSYVAIKWNSRPTAEDISKCKNQYGLDRMKYIDYVTKKKEFYAMLRIIMDLVIRCDGICLFYIGTNDGILRVYEWIAHEYPQFLGDIGIFTSLLSQSEKLKEKKKKLLLSTTKSAGLGEHINGLKMTIVLAEPFKSEVIARQTLGRTRDPNTLYIELVDLGFRYIKKYYYEKLPVFKKYAQDVSDSTIDNYELIRRAENLIQEYKPKGEVPIMLEDRRFDFRKVGLLDQQRDEEIEFGIVNDKCPIYLDKDLYQDPLAPFQLP